MTLDRLTELCDNAQHESKCPFCQSPRAPRHSPSTWKCGTYGPDENGEYETGTECDKTVFRNGYLRCLGMLKRLLVSEKSTLNLLQPKLIEDIKAEIGDIANDP